MRKAFVKGLRAQSSIETIIIMSIALFILAALSGIVYDQIAVYTSEQEQKTASIAVSAVAKEVDDVYFLGPGTIKTILVKMPNGIDFARSSIEGRTLILNVYGNDIFASTKVDVRGVWPDESGSYTFTISAYDDYVSISVRPVDVAPNQVNDHLAQGESNSFSLVLSNGSQNENKSFLMVADFPSPSSDEVSLSYSLQEPISIAPNDTNTVDFSVSCSLNSFGSYTGKIIFVPQNSSDSNITVPVNLFCSSAQTKLTSFPQSKKFYALTDSVSEDSLLVCNTTSRDFSSSKTSVLGSIAPYVVTSFSEGIKANSCINVPFVINAPSESSSYSGSLSVTSGGFSSGALLELLAYAPQNSVSISWDDAYFGADGNSINDINVSVLVGPFSITNAMVLFLNDLDDANVTALYLSESNKLPLGSKLSSGEIGEVVDFNLARRKTYDMNIIFDANIRNDSEKFRLVLKSSEGIYFWSPIFDPTSTINDSNASHFSNLKYGQEPIYPRSANLISLWRMDDLNSSGYTTDVLGRNDAYVISANKSEGLWDTNAFNFDGSNSYIEVSDNDSLDLTNQWTISAWINRSQINSQQGIVEKYDWQEGQGVLGVRVTSSNNLIAFVVNGTSASDCGATTTSLAQNTWYNVVATFDANSDRLSCYVNGVLESSNLSATVNPVAGSKPLRIGARGDDASNKFNGLIDDVAIWDTALSADEVREIYSIGSGVHDFNTQADGNGLYLSRTADGNFLLDGNFYSRVFDFNGVVDFNKVEFIRNQLGSDSKYLKVNYSDFNNDSSLASFSSLNSGKNYFAATGELDWNKGGDYSVNGSSWDSGLVAYYKFNSKSGSAVYDSARGHNGTLSGGADVNGIGLWDTNSVWLNGASGYVDLGAIFDPTGSSFTVSAWFYPERLSGAVVGMWGGSWSKIEINLNGGNMLVYNSNNDGPDSTTNCGTVVTGKWQHVMVSANASTGKVDCYLDGIKNGTGNLSSGAFANGQWNVGGRVVGSAVQQLFSGRIDEVKIYNRPLSQSEILSDYNSFLNAKFVYKNSFDSNYVTNWSSIVFNPDTNYSFGKEISASEKFGAGLIGLWHMDESSGINVADSSGKGNNGIASFDKGGGYAVSYDGDYTVYTFTQSGTFTPTVPLSDVEVLIVGGGGAGGGAIGGGGGAGGLIHTTIDLSAQPYSVTVGQGAVPLGASGYSFFADLNAFGGGNGGSGNANDQTNGGSGGGQSVNGSVYGLGTAGQGNNGGSYAASWMCGGGGGAGSIGGDGGNGGAGSGGSGVAVDINGSSVYYSAGGGGGSYLISSPALGGSGIGGNGGYGEGAQVYGMDGVNGTGSGGGGGGWLGSWSLNENGGSGGNGIVIIKFLTSQMSSETTGLWGTESATFNGIDQNIVVSNSSDFVLSEFSISSWVNVNDFFGAYDNRFIIDNTSSGSSNGYYLAAGLCYDTSWYPCFSAGEKSWGAYSLSTPSSVKLETGRWHNVVFTYNPVSQNHLIYLDGVLVGSSTGVYHTDPISPSNPLAIGSSSNGASFFSGSIEEVAVWNRVLSSDEIIDLYRKGVSRLDLNVYSCSDVNCLNKTGSQYISAVNNSISTSLNSNVLNSRYLGFDAYFRKATGFEDYNAGMIWAGSFVKDVNVGVYASRVDLYVRTSINGFSWSNWSDAVSSSPYLLGLNDANYFQYKAVLSRGVSADSSPVLADVNVTYSRIGD